MAIEKYFIEFTFFKLKNLGVVTHLYYRTTLLNHNDNLNP